MCQQIDMKPDVQIPVPAARLFKWNVAMSLFHTTFAILVLAAIADKGRKENGHRPRDEEEDNRDPK